MNNGLIDLLETAVKNELATKEDMLTIIKSVTQQIEIEITENDIEEFKEMLENDETIEWSFNTVGANLPIGVTIMSEDELNQRNR